ncbi:MAG: anti-sigma factor [Candidatus Limnocylindria bacterium]
MMTMIDCREAVARMWAYLSQGLGRPDVEELEEHLGVCQRCCGELEFSRQLQEKIAGAGAGPISPDLGARIETLLRSNEPPAERP